MNTNTDCKHSTKLTGKCVKCGEYPYDSHVACMNTNQQAENKTDTVRYSGKCYGENRHWHLSTSGRWTYHVNVKCSDCQNADQKYNIQTN